MKIKYNPIILLVFIIIIVIITLPYIGNTEKVTCENEGGEWIQAGLSQEFRCVHKYFDGGKPCSSSNECIGGCIVSDLSGSAYCKHDDNPFGCYATIEDFREQPSIICVD